jgi:hypothetical protein
MKRILLAASLAALVSGAISAHAASIPPMSPQQCQIPEVCADINAMMTSSLNPNLPGFTSMFVAKNYLDNGAMFVKQRGTAAIAGGSTAGCAVLSYIADRWCVDTNVGSGVGKGQVATATPTPPPGFQNEIKVWRDSGALTQPVELMQEIETARFIQLQGKTVIASCYVQPMAALSSASGAVTMNLVTGTGTDEGLGALRSAVGMTASPAITPALTGVATQALTAGVGSSSFNLGTTAVWSRIWSAPVPVPATATEGVFMIGFTPVGSASGTTDGFAVTGCMLEQADPNQVAPSAYEFLQPDYDLRRSQRFYWQIADPAATVALPSACFVTTANTTVKCSLWLPVQMAITPVTAIPVSASFGVVATAGTAGTCTALAATASSSSVNSVGVTCTTAATIALGSATPLIGAAAASANINASADF